MILGGGTKVSGYQSRPPQLQHPTSKLLTTKDKADKPTSSVKTSPKAGHFIKIPKTRPTRKVCQERLACKDRRDAVFNCEQCHTLQCDVCEALIHENPRCVFHDREKLEVPNKEHLCQEHNCENRNFADVYCTGCKKRLCFACEVVLHHLRGKNHKRIPFEADDYFSLTNHNSAIEVGEEPASFYSIEEPDEKEYLASVFEGAFDSLGNNGISEQQSEFHSIRNTSNEMALESISFPDVASVGNIYNVIEDSRRKAKTLSDMPRSFLLIDDTEALRVDDECDFIKSLGCKNDTMVKVVSIFGNTGAGKSHTLNHTFFNGKEVFKTSSTQVSCTIGVWAAFDPVHNAIVLDTEGLLGTTSNQHQRTRLLLKVLAVSDVIIYRTRAERLQNDLFTFLGDASKAYSHHFSHELKAASKRFNFEGPLSSLGPGVIIFQETMHTHVLVGDRKKSCEDALKERFHTLDQSIDAFSALQYVGVRTTTPPTSFVELSAAVKKQLNNLSVRSARVIGVVYKALKVLNDKFSGQIDKTVPSTFPDQYFTCNANCLSCETRCTLSMNHIQDGVPHQGTSNCRYKSEHENKIYICRVCYERGETVVVIPKTSASSESSWLGIAKYAWTGYVLECTNCGVIYRSRQYWYGNKDPWETAVRTEIRHIWPGSAAYNQNNQNAARRVLDSVGYLSEAVSSIGAKPTRMVSSWMADKIAPDYWKPNSDITNCKVCLKSLEEETKHHCRACGEGICDDCSTKTKPVPERGWGSTPVRVCDDCYEGSEAGNAGGLQKEEAITVRVAAEVLQNTIGSVASTITNYPLELIKDAARPDYWVPDEQIKDCALCKVIFSPKFPLHHCRGCGQGICDPCSKGRLQVKSRGWDHPVRVCKVCEKRNDL